MMMRKVWIKFAVAALKGGASRDGAAAAANGLLADLNKRFPVSVGEAVEDSPTPPVRAEALPIDLTPITFYCFSFKGETLKIRKPITVTPDWNPHSQLFTATIRELSGLTLTGKTRDQLLQDWEVQMRFVWETYALASEEGLAPDALRLRDSLLWVVQDSPLWVAQDER